MAGADSKRYKDIHYYITIITLFGYFEEQVNSKSEKYENWDFAYSRPLP